MAHLKDLRAFVVGWTGACGEQLVKQLADRATFKEVVLLGRRKVDFPEDDARSKLKQEIIDFDDLDKSSHLFADCHVGYCAMGTTRRDAGASGFVKVDYDYIMGVAKISKDQGCKQFHLISSTGANKNSPFLYPQIKGKVEAEVTDLGFDQLFIYRPALILRGEKGRFGEKVSAAFLKPITYFKPDLLQVSTEIVARSMIKNSETYGVEGAEKMTLLTNTSIHQVAKDLAQ